MCHYVIMYPTPTGLPEKRQTSVVYRGSVPILPINGKKEYPMYAFFLHTEVDKDVADYLSQKGSWLDALTGNDCLICTFEKPSNWDEGWKDAWKKQLGDDFDKNYAQWEALTNYTKAAYASSLAERLGVPLNHMPCMVFVENLHSHKILQIPFIANKDDYDRYFMDVLTCIRAAAKADQEKRLTTLDSKWRKYWIKWIIPQKVKEMSKSIQEWGSLFSDTKDEVVSVLDIVSPIIKRIGFQ